MALRRRFIAVPEDVVFEAVKLAEREGVSVAVFIERVLTEVIKALKYRGNVIDMIVNADAVEDLRRLGGVLLPSKVAYRVISRLSDEEFKELLSELERAAAWYGNLSKIKRGSDVGELKRALALWVPEATVDILPVGEKVFKAVIAVPEQGARIYEVVKSILKGLMKGLEMKLSKVEGGQGVITVEVEVG